MALVGNKADLHENRAVSSQVSSGTTDSSMNLVGFGQYLFRFQGDDRSFILKDALEYADKNGMFFIETSAKTADNINELFEVYIHVALTMSLNHVWSKPVPHNKRKKINHLL